MESELDALVAEVLRAPKYRAIDPGLVRAVAARELAAHGRPKHALKETKGKLHQITGAYHDGQPRYNEWLAALRPSPLDRSALLGVMRRHASTRERLPILDRFYAEALAGLPPPRSVLDLACGLSPLAHSWLGLAEGASYSACDIDAEMVAFVGAYLGLCGRAGRAFMCDLAAATPPDEADLALVLKTLPVLEQVAPGSALRLLRELRAPALLVSFPAASLGGRKGGMAASYERWFLALIAGEGWQTETFRFASEIAFLVRR